ncbi:isoflavone reductase family protein [Plectosphaerella plurivora]|uniref:Isoflavone reductase family protein n=1 Tax=Plectosphaerella plurivora TaxID=936078 RepID=A0A9P8V3P5_9PEZI|nr:isoflavone reductase family protein [Plectosphaerella plurivora]
MSSPLKNIALIGANGTLGQVLLDALVAAGTFNVTAIIRAGSLSTVPYPDSQVRTIHVDKAMSLDSLTEAFTGQDAVIASFKFANPQAHVRVVEAAAAAGVRLHIPADFGSIDADNERARELVPLYREKLAIRTRAQELAAEVPSFSWTALVTGHFFEWGVKEHLFHTDLERHTADVFDGGHTKASATTLTRIGEAVVRILRKYPDEAILNRVLFIQSFCISQIELVEALERATGKKWTVNDLDSEKFIEEKRPLGAAGDSVAIEDLVFVLGALDADWTKRGNLAMELLGFEDEDLDATLQRVLAEP